MMRAPKAYRDERLRRAMRLLCDNGLSLPAARKAGNKELFTPNTIVWVTALGRVLAILEERRAVAYPLCVSEVKVVPGKESELPP